MSIESPMKEASMDVDSQPESITLETQPLYRFGVGESTATEERPASTCLDYHYSFSSPICYLPRTEPIEKRLYIYARQSNLAFSSTTDEKGSIWHQSQ